MSRSRRAWQGGPAWRRQARVLLVSGSLLLALTTVGFLFLGKKPEAYIPGSESERSEEITRALQRDLPPDRPQIAFIEATEEAGVSFRHFHGNRSTQLPEDMGSGAAWGDYDGDGDPDLFLANEAGPLTLSLEQVAASPAKSKLLRNEGNGRFTDVTTLTGVDAPGWAMGAAWGDYDGDGALDLVVTRFGSSLLFRNRRDGTFEEVSAATGLAAEEGFWTGASWADFDRDGDLDLYVCGYIRYASSGEAARKATRQYDAVVPYTLNPSSYPPEKNLLWRNEGGRFREVAKRAGVDNPTGRSLSATWADFDSDGWPDLYVANDISDNAMYRNLGGGRFADISHPAWVADHRGAMGLGVGDWDNDEDLDIFITHWIAQENALYDNQRGTIAASEGEPLHFVDDADHLGLGQISLDFIGWGTEFLDYDNDGRLDLFAANGSTFQAETDPSRLVPMKNQLFWNGGKSRGFFELGAVSGEAFARENVARGAAVADYDSDGDLDIAVVVNGGGARLLRNDGGNRNGWLRVVLRGPTQEKRGGPSATALTSSFATGARVRLKATGVTQIREVGGSSSYLSQSPPGEVWFGTGSASRVDWLEIRWPSGASQTLEDLPVRTTVTLSEGGEALLSPKPGETSSDPAASGGPPGDPRRLARKETLRFWESFRAATALRGKGDFAAAAARYREALQIDASHEDSLYYLGQSLLETGQHLDAAQSWERLVAVNPHSARGHLAIGALFSSPDEKSPRDLVRAELHLRRAHEINGEETGPMVRLGEVLIAAGRIDEAEEWLRSAARTNPKSVEAAFLAGYVRWRSGDRTGAAEDYRKALRAAKSERPPRGVLGEGDRKGTGAQEKIAAPPLTDPMGKTLFGAFSEGLRRGTAADSAVSTPANLDEIYRPMQRYVTALSPSAAARAN